MKRGYVADGEVIIALQGLRWVESDDRVSPTYAYYYLKWNFKGSDNTHEYKSKEARDAIFQELRASLLGEKGD